MLGYLININNLCCNPVVLKKIDKISKKMLFWAQFTQKGVIMGHAQTAEHLFEQK